MWQIVRKLLVKKWPKTLQNVKFCFVPTNGETQHIVLSSSDMCTVAPGLSYKILQIQKKSDKILYKNQFSIISIKIKVILIKMCVHWV